jgi:hypothetical protein
MMPLMPGEKVRSLRRFDDYAGLFLHHCHDSSMRTWA